MPLHASPAPVLVTRAGGTLSAVGISVSPDGKWFASEAQNSAITIWSTEDGSEFRTIQPFTAFSQLAPPGHLAVASDASTLAVLAGADVHLIDVRTGHELRSIAVSSSPLDSWQIAANPKQMVIAVINQEGSAVVWSIADGHELFRTTIPVSNHQSIPELQVRFSPDGRLLAVTTDNTFQLWDWAAKRKLLSFDAHALHKPNLTRSVTVEVGNSTKQSTAEAEHYFWFSGASFASDGKHLALTSRDELNVFDLPSGKPAAFTKFESGMMPGCIFIDSDHILLPQINLDVAFYSLSNGTLGTATNVNVQDYALVPGRDRGVLLAGVPYLVSASTFAIIKALFTETRPPESLTFTHDGKQLLVSNYFKSFASWSLDSGEADAFPAASEFLSPAISGDGKYLAAVDALSNRVRVLEMAPGHNETQIPVKTRSLDSTVAISADGSILGLSQKSGQVDLLSLSQKSSVTSFTADQPTKIAIEPDGQRFAIADRSGTTVYSVSQPPVKMASLPIDDPQGLFKKTAPYALSFSPDGKWLAIMETTELRLVSTQTWTETRKIEGVGGLCLAFSPDSQRIALTMQSQGVEVADLTSGQVLFQDNEHLTSCPMAFSADGSVLAAAAQYSTELFSMQSGKVLGNLYLYSDETQIPKVPIEKQQLDWLVVTPDGLFDGTPGAWSRLSWRFSENTFDVSPVEIFFQNFYRPGLLAEIVSGRVPKAPTDIAGIDRRQPEVVLSSSAGSSDVSTRTAHMELSISEAPRDGAHNSGSGVRDVRLFRNGVLVRAWRGNVKLDRSGKATFSADLPIAAGENRFTAYAFNSANIKSSDSSLMLTGAGSLRRDGTAWIISMGINHYADATPQNHLDLSFAEGDAADFGSQFSKAQAAFGQFARVRRIDLLGSNATKANLQAAFRLLAGASIDALSPDQQQLFSGISQVQPEDGVFFFYAGHGAALDNHFYLIPQDFHFDNSLNDPRSHTVSDMELGQMLEDIAPARGFLIIDACNSGQAIDSSTPVGPVNATGLAQLAYEKGLYILAASKDSEPALEAYSLGSGHGFLTYALVDEGLKEGAAAENGLVELRPWFAYARRRVPELQAAQLERRALIPADKTPANGARQHPRIFYRREPETNPFIVAKTAPAALSQK